MHGLRGVELFEPILIGDMHKAYNVACEELGLFFDLRKGDHAGRQEGRELDNAGARSDDLTAQALRFVEKPRASQALLAAPSTTTGSVSSPDTYLRKQAPIVSPLAAFAGQRLLLFNGLLKRRGLGDHAHGEPANAASSAMTRAGRAAAGDRSRLHCSGKTYRTPTPWDVDFPQAGAERRRFDQER
jgi:hypothetical protein